MYKSFGYFEKPIDQFEKIIIVSSMIKILLSMNLKKIRKLYLNHQTLLMI